MKRTYPVLSFILLVGLIYYSFFNLMPRKAAPSNTPETEFSAERALIPLQEISKAPHYIGSAENIRVREYLIQQLKDLGLTPETQEGYILNPKWDGMDKPVNIIARIKGSDSSNALLVFTHYDSALVPSFGASDAGSGVVTILESIRAYMASGKTPKNDVVILFTDGEEVGLDGAKLFVRDHPWAKNVSLALNFEARGSGGPSNMIVETNQGNQKLIEGFIEANPEYPVASSLMYSIYKMLPNDTDSTVLREEGDIDGLFFAFIDDHFDYHTANDNFDRLDRNTLQHQGSYLLPLMHYFGDADLSQLKTDVDYVYVNFPLIGMIAYPFSWTLPMVLIAALLLVLLIAYGLKRGRLSWHEIGRGFIPFILSLLLAGAFGYYGWKLLLKIYPQYLEIQHGFTYNGHVYIAFFVAITVALLFGLYRKHARRIHPANLVIAPLFFWILINFGLALYLKGGAFFIIPIYFGLLSLWVLIRQKFPNLLLMVLLAAPALFIFTPLVQFFPVGLGLKMLVASCLFTVLIFGLLLPILGFYRIQKFLAYLMLVVAAGFFISAHFSSDFAEGRQKPNSLIYYTDTDTQTSYWLTYDSLLDDWTRGFIGEEGQYAKGLVLPAAKSKYNSGYTYASEAPYKTIPRFQAFKNKDTLIANNREVSFTIVPQRDVDVLRVYADTSLYFDQIHLNGIVVKPDSTGRIYANRKDPGLFSFYVAPEDTLQIAYVAPKELDIAFDVVEFSFDLLSHPEFTIPERPKNMMTKPFVFTDAVAQKGHIHPNTLTPRKLDSLKSKPHE